MSIYEGFAALYAKGPWPQYSQRMAELLPTVLERFGAQPRTVLDLACGEGTFAVAMAKKGLRVTGVDRSQEMVRLAQERAAEDNVHVEFLIQDMRSLTLKDRFDLATCWFDSLNYILEVADLEQTFVGVSGALNRGGLFIFDMNTVYGVAIDWQRFPCYVQLDATNLFQVACPAYDVESETATLRIIAFVKKGKAWHRIDEEHQERGYTVEQIRHCVGKAGLREVACWGNLEEMTEPKGDSSRIWFVLQK